MVMDGYQHNLNNHGSSVCCYAGLESKMNLFFRNDKRREVPLIPDLTFRPPLLEPIMICFVLFSSSTLVPLTPLTQLNRKQNCKYQQISLTLLASRLGTGSGLLLKLFLFLEYLIGFKEVFGLLLKIEFGFLNLMNIILFHHWNLFPRNCCQF